MLIGLQSNALKFTENGKVETVVEILNQNQSEKYLKISVNDTGIGIAKKDHHKLFKMFGYVQDNQQMNVNGIGLGLAISQQIVKKFKGEIKFTS